MLGRCLVAYGLSTAAGLMVEDRRSSTAALSLNRDNNLCNRDYDLSLSQSRVTYSNLGSAGPDVGRPRGILFSGIFQKLGLNIDMDITTRQPYYTADVSPNRVNGEFLGVAVDDGATAALRITFVDPRSNTPMKVPRVTITLAELIAPSTGGGAMSVNVSGVHSYRTNQPTSVAVTKHGDVLTFTGTSPVPEVPPLLSKAMGKDALRKAVSLQLRDVDSIDMNLTAAPGNASRVFYIGGLSNLVCPTQRTCDTLTCPEYHSLKAAPEEIYCAGPKCNVDDYNTCCSPDVPVLCTTKHQMVFPTNSVKYSNLGGLGPDFGWPSVIRYANVFPGSGSEVDLVIRNTSEYTSADPADNGLSGPRARISVAAGTSVNLTFTLKPKSKDNFHFLRKGFHFTVYDLDEEADGHGVEKVAASGFSAYRLANTTMVRVRTDGEGRSVFDAIKYTHAMRADKSNLELNKIDLGKAVSFEYPPDTRSLDMTLSVSHGHESHGFLFSGFSTLACPAQATCRTYECPGNMLHRAGRNSILCAASECSTHDETVCCQLEEPSANPATCDTYSCPGYSRLKPFAQNLKCMWEECTVKDEGTCCIIYEKDECSVEKGLILRNVSYSNLGGAGPDFGKPEAILYQNVFPGFSRKIDLKVTAATSASYATVSNPLDNGVVGALASVSVPTGESMMLDFTFLEHGTKKKAKHLWPYILTVVRLGSGRHGQAQQGVRFPGGVTKFMVTDFSQIAVSGNESGPSFVASRYTPRRKDDSTPLALHPLALTPVDENSSVVVMMNKTNFQMEMSVSPMNEEKAGRTREVGPRAFQFAGASSMTCSQMSLCTSYTCPAGYAHKTSASWTVCQSEVCNELDLYTCCDCDDVGSLSFAPDSLVSSSFGNGLSGSMALSNVFPNSGHRVKMQISTIGEYYANNGTVTGLNGEFLDCNLRAGAGVTLKFNFSLPSGEPYVAPSFFFSVFDLDRQKDGGGMESVRVTDTEYFRLTEPSAVIYDAGTNAFSGTVSGKIWDNPTNPMALTPKHLRHSVSFLMKPNISEFMVFASNTPGWSGRNIVFGGASNVVCPERALCIKAECPAGMLLNEHAARMVCRRSVCVDEDVPHCCVDA